MWFDGRVDGDTMRGTLWVSRGSQTRDIPWLGRRDLVDFSGTWEWAGPSHAPVQLKIERRDGRLAATCVDQTRKHGGGDSPLIRVTDFYDFGGGFYFTLLLGLEGSSLTRGSRRMGPADGWLIGEAVAQNNALSGSLAFYPYPDGDAALPAMAQPGQSRRTSEPPPGRREWHPKRVAP